MPNQSRITAEGEIIVKDWAKTQGLKVEFTDELVDDLANGKYKNGTLYISRYSINPIKIVIKHEFTHSTEGSKLYEDFRNYLFDKDSKAFKEWLNKKGFKTWTDAFNYEYQKLEDAGLIKKYKNPTEVAKNEVVANFVSETLFNKDGTDFNDEITLDFLTELNQKDRNLFQRFVDFIKSILKRLTTRGAANRDIIKLEQKFLRLVETARQQRAKVEIEKRQGEQNQGEYSLPDVDNLSEEQYNNFGWVRANDVLTAAEYSTLHSRYTGHKHTNDNFPVTRFGETVVHSSDYNDVLMYVKGSIVSPQITKVVRIDDTNPYILNTVKEELLKLERAQTILPFSFIRDVYGEGILGVYRLRDYASLQELQRRRKRKDSTKDDSSNRTEQDGKGSTKQNKETSRADSIDGSVYSLPEIPDIAKGKSNTELEQLIKEGKITLDDAVNSMNDQYGTMPKGENPKVDVDVPNKVSDTKGVRRFARTALESGHLTEGMSEDAKKQAIKTPVEIYIACLKYI